MNIQDKDTCRLAIDALLQELEKGSFTKEKMDALCRQFPECSEELEAASSMWQAIAQVDAPDPSHTMDAGFYKMLNEFKDEETQHRVAFENIRWLPLKRQRLRWVGVAAVFLLGMLSGAFFLPKIGGSAIAGLNKEPIEKKTDYATLASTESITDRLREIQKIKEMEDLDERIIEALKQVLQFDDNDNVRLSAIETMLHFADNPKAREVLIKAIPYQDSPLIQMTLAEIMIAFKDKRAINEIKKLLENGSIELEVKMKMEETIEVLL